MSRPIRDILGERVLLLRRRAKLSQPELAQQAGMSAVYLPNADKYRRLPRRPPKGQKVLYERALMASQRPFHSW